MKAAGVEPPPGLELRNLSAGYGGGRGFRPAGRAGRPVLEGIGFSVRAGELVVLAGPNGSGKTTLLKTAGGLIPPLAGAVMLGGRDAASFSRRERAAFLAFLFQGALPAWPFTIREFAAQGRFPRTGLFGAEGGEDRRAVEEALAEAGLRGLEERPVTELSGGEFQRVLIARAMAQEAALLLLDEPCNNLDPKYRFAVMDLIRGMTRRGTAVLMSLHDLVLAEHYADRIVLLHRGGIAAMGPPGEALKEEVLERVFEVSHAAVHTPRAAYGGLSSR
ncbi:MAG: ABC transporter ATP-binding protein [Treponema sp.]|nr:ABC transporter ATP-binding protein [Treponema sp.]